MKKKNKSKSSNGLKSLGLYLLTLSAVLSGVLYHEYSRPSSEKLIKRAMAECEDAGPLQQLCAYVNVMNACQPDEKGHWLDLKICGIVGRR